MSEMVNIVEMVQSGQAHPVNRGPFLNFNYTTTGELRISLPSFSYTYAPVTTVYVTADGSHFPEGVITTAPIRSTIVKGRLVRKTA